MSTLELTTTPVTSTASSSDVSRKVRLRFLPASSRIEAMTLWKSLEVELCNQRLTCSSAWTDTWLDHYGGLVPFQFVIGMRQGTIVGIALLTQGVRQSAGPFRLKTWHVGTAGEPESTSVCVQYNSVLCHPDDWIDFGQALWNWAQQETNCDEFRWDGFESTSIAPLLAQYPQSRVERRVAYYFDLESVRATGEDPIMRLGSHTRANIRRTQRDLGGVQVEWAETIERAEFLFHQLVELHQARWNSIGLPGVYSSERFHDFHLDLLHRLFPLGLMSLVGVSAGGRLLACSQLLVDNNRTHFYQCGRVPSSGRVSHGLILDYSCICECLRRGFDEVDFLGGETDHKRRLSTSQAELAWVAWRRPNIKNTAIDTLRRIKQATAGIRRDASANRTPSGSDTAAVVLPKTKESLP
ncbi:MAG: GNAT family N-acetyltransferase [Planctomycetes bacterium]|nr:GNAT family N-acetyltransferase [Planctomycetota bacterium]